MILAGLGAHRAGAKAEIEQLADRIGALLATSARGKDMFRGHPANLGIVGSFSHSAARRMIDQADCVVVFGAGLNLLTMSFGHSLPKVPLIQVDADRSHIGRWHPADVAVVGDARLAAQALLEALPPGSNADRPFRSDETLRFLSEFDIARDFEPANTAAHGRPALARRGAREAAAGAAQSRLRRRQLPGNRALSFRAGTGPLQADQRLRLDRHGLRHGAGRGQGAARRDHRAGRRRRRLPDDPGRAGDGGARGPAAGDRR